MQDGFEYRRQGALEAFRKRRAEIENASPTEQMAFQYCLALFWRAFIAQHGVPERFAQLPRKAQKDYFNKMLSLQARLFEQKDEGAIPLIMLNFYLMAIIHKDHDHEIEAATFLDAQSRLGWPLVEATIYD
jgi:hypothetical protein